MAFAISRFWEVDSLATMGDRNGGGQPQMPGVFLALAPYLVSTGPPRFWFCLPVPLLTLTAGPSISAWRCTRSTISIPLDCRMLCRLSSEWRRMQTSSKNRGVGSKTMTPHLLTPRAPRPGFRRRDHQWFQTVTVSIAFTSR